MEGMKGRGAGERGARAAALQAALGDKEPEPEPGLSSSSQFTLSGKTDCRCRCETRARNHLICRRKRSFSRLGQIKDLELVTTVRNKSSLKGESLVE
jgi:hypothetical protein